MKNANGSVPGWVVVSSLPWEPSKACGLPNKNMKSMVPMWCRKSALDLFFDLLFKDFFFF